MEEGITQVHLPASDTDAEMVVHRYEEGLFIEIYYSDEYTKAVKSDHYQFMLDKEQKQRLLDLLMYGKTFKVVFNPDAVDSGDIMPIYTESPLSELPENTVPVRIIPHEIDYDTPAAPKRKRRRSAGK
jgi:hypothetical protein